MFPAWSRYSYQTITDRTGDVNTRRTHQHSRAAGTMLNTTTHANRIMGSAALGLVLAVALGCSTPGEPQQAASAPTSKSTCDPGNGGITLSPGFCASVFADNLGHVRHAVVGADGTLYVNIWSGRYYAGQPVPDDGFLVALED